MSEITSTANAPHLGAPQKPAEAWGGSWPRRAGAEPGVPFGPGRGGGSSAASLSHKISGVEAGRAHEGLARSRAGPPAADAARSFPFSRPTGPAVVGVAECGFSKL